jgi:hypothetical protein
MNILRISITALFIITFYFIVIALPSGVSRKPEPTYSKGKWSCPSGYQVTAGENDLVQGRDFTQCSK